MHLLFITATSSDDNRTFAISLGVGFGVAFYIWLVFKIRLQFFDKSLRRQLVKFLGEELRKSIELHEKTFPGYDLVSINRAINSFFSERCSSSAALGAATFDDVRTVLNAEPGTYIAKQKPSTPAYTRLPVDVDEEESFVSSCIYACRLKPEAADAPEEKVLVILQSVSSHANVEEDMGEQAAPLTIIKLTIACRTKQIANLCFADLEGRRNRLSVYRGKVVDPIVAAGGIRSISFKRIHRVAADDLVLAENVKSLIEGAVVGFYQNQELLRSVGVEMKRGILFHSPPGTGKTSISLYLAGLLPQFTVCFVSGRRLLYPREICSMARYLQPSMIVFEDIDLIAQERNMNGLATVLGELMNQIDGCEPNDQVLFIMNTNSMDRLEQAVRDRPGRVDQIIQIPLPDRAARVLLLKRFAAQVQVQEGAIEKLAEVADGATPALLKEVIKRAAVLSIGAHANNGRKAPIILVESDLLLAYAQVQSMRETRPEAAQIL